MVEGFFEPCPLSVLAEHMRDGRWLDIRTDECLMQRVRILEIVVRVSGEEVVVRQEWLDGDDFCKQQFAIDSDAIWKALPTNYHPEQVVPYGIAPTIVPVERMSDVDGHLVLAAITVTAKHLFGQAPTTLPNGTDARYACILVGYEMTDLGAETICKEFGYSSPTPWNTGVRYRLMQAEAGAELKRVARRLQARTDSRLAHHGRTFRRADPNYSPVL